MGQVEAGQCVMMYGRVGHGKVRQARTRAGHGGFIHECGYSQA